MVLDKLLKQATSQHQSVTRIHVLIPWIMSEYSTAKINTHRKQWILVLYTVSSSLILHRMEDTYILVNLLVTHFALLFCWLQRLEIQMRGACDTQEQPVPKRPFLLHSAWNMVNIIIWTSWTSRNHFLFYVNFTLCVQSNWRSSKSSKIRK